MFQSNVRRSLFGNTSSLLLIGGVIGLSLAGCGGGKAMMTGSADTVAVSEVTRDVKVPADGVRTLTPILTQLTYLSETLAGRDVSTPPRSNAYPKITATRGNKTASVTVDYGPDPIPTLNGKHMISGSVTMVVDLNTRTGSITCNNLTVDGNSVSGTLALANASLTTSLFTATVSFDLTTSGYGRLAGSVTYSKTLEANSGFGIPTGSLTATPTTGTPTSVTIGNLTMNPVTYRNFVPDNGTTTLVYTVTARNKPVQVTQVITYSSTSPVTGQVTVSINGGTPYTMTLPNF